jgi:hypothetical protein
MLALDSLVTDLIFQQGAAITPDALMAALGGADAVSQHQMLDPDMQDPRFEMELSPTRPFRRTGERRLMIIDPSVAPMRENPHEDPLVPLDLRADKERLVQACEALPVRVGRLSALGSWGDAVLVARSPRDLRALALLAWLLDPTLDVDGNRRPSPLGRAEIEAKLLAYDKRLDELDDQAILASVHAAKLERRGDLIILDVLGEDGTWDLRDSMALEMELAAIEQFSRVPGAPSRPPVVLSRPEPEAASGTKPAPTASATAPAAPPAPAAPARVLPPLRLAEIAGRVALVFPPERFDLDVAAALGKRDYDAVLVPGDAVPGSVRDRIYREGVHFVAPLEFLSEVFIEGKPLSRPMFEQGARPVAEGVRALEVHCPRFGPVVLVDIAGLGRFICSATDAPGDAAALVR